MAAFSDVLLTVDFDRTLTAPDSTIPQRNVEAISYFIANGGGVAALAYTLVYLLVCGRTQVFRDVVPVNAPLLLYNGSAAYDLSRKEFTFLHRIPLDQEETIRKLQAAFPGLALEMQGLDAHYAFAEDPAWDAFCRNNHCAMGHAHPGDDLGCPSTPPFPLTIPRWPACLMPPRKRLPGLTVWKPGCAKFWGMPVRCSGLRP